MYKRQQYDRALECWEYSRERDDTFPTVHRNLALVYYNKKQEADKALASLEKAYMLNTGDSRVLMELDQLYKKVGRGPEERAVLLEAHMEQTQDLSLIHISLTVPENHVFILGDYRTQTVDSRDFGPVPMECVAGKVITILRRRGL